MNTQTKNSLLLLLCSFIWGTAFVAQSAGSGMGAYSFLAGRSWLAVLVLIPTVLVFDVIRRKNGTDEMCIRDRDLRGQNAGGWALYRYGSLFGAGAPEQAAAECAALRALTGKEG